MIVLILILVSGCKSDSEFLGDWVDVDEQYTYLSLVKDGSFSFGVPGLYWFKGTYTETLNKLFLSIETINDEPFEEFIASHNELQNLEDLESTIEFYAEIIEGGNLRILNPNTDGGPIILRPLEEGEQIPSNVLSNIWEDAFASAFGSGINQDITTDDTETIYPSPTITREEPTQTPTPRATSTPTAVPSPTLTPTPEVAPAFGFYNDRTYIVPMNEKQNFTIDGNKVGISIVEVRSGNEAWQTIKSANMFNDPPPTGMQYFLVKMGLENLSTDDTSSININPASNFFLLSRGWAGKDYPWLVLPKPALSDLEILGGGYAEGWVAFLGYEDDAYPFIFVGGSDMGKALFFSTGSMEFQDFSSSRENEVNINNSENHGSLRNPVGINGSGVFLLNDYSWIKIFVTEVHRDSEALSILKDVNMFNDDPPEGYEYILAKITIELSNNYIAFLEFESSDVYFVSESQKIRNNSEWLVLPFPSTATSNLIFPGGRAEFWICTAIVKNDPTPVTFIFDRAFALYE